MLEAVNKKLESLKLNPGHVLSQETFVDILLVIEVGQWVFYFV